MLSNGSAWGFPSGSVVKKLPEVQETRVQSLGREDPLEEGMATHSSILAWRISWTEEPGGLQSTGSQRVGHDSATEHSTRMVLLTCCPPVRSTLIRALCTALFPKVLTVQMVLSGSE